LKYFGCPVVPALAGSLGAAASGTAHIRSSLSTRIISFDADDDGTNSSLSAALIGSSGANLFQIRVGSDASAPGHGYRGVVVSCLVLVLGSAVLLLSVAALLAAPTCARSTVAADAGLPGW
jgi:hypothetical protein